MSSTRSADHIGRVLGDRYRLVAAIGTGASAHVFLADDVRLRRRVAVKILHPALATDESFLRRFRAEARAAAALNHPHVLAVYDWGEETDGPYLVSEFLGGGSLRSMLDTGHRLTPSQALLVGLETARGLDYAHRRGLVHRDIKPANLLFDDDGRLRIADFGLARALAEAAWTEPAGAVLGTARYAAPEQARGEPLDGRADVYALAVVLVEAVTGVVPFAGETTVATLMARLDRSLEVPETLGPIGPVVARAGRCQASERLDAAALAAALGAVAGELPTPARLPLAGAAAAGERPREPQPDATELGPSPIRFGADRPLGAGDQRPERPLGAGDQRPERPLGAGDQRPERPLGAGEQDPTRVELIGGEPTVMLRGGADPQPVASSRRQARRAAAAPNQAIQTGEPRRRRRVTTVALALLVAALLAGAATFAFVATRVPTHLVPLVAEKTLEIATGELKALRFEVRSQGTFSDDKAPGTVLGQRPAPGTRLAEGEEILLTVSDGPPPVAVPDLSGLNQAQATAKLTEAGHRVGVVTPRNDEEISAGLVIDWTLKGQSPPKGTAVDLVVSSGPEKRRVPEGLLGKIFDEVDDILGNLGLTGVKAEAFTDDDDDKGRVVSLNPPAGQRVDRGSRVTVAVSLGQPIVPETRGLTTELARARLEAAGLKLGQAFGPRGGKAFSSVPEPSTKTKPGASVDIYLKN